MSRPNIKKAQRMLSLLYFFWKLLAQSLLAQSLLANPEPLDDYRRTWSQLAKLVRDDCFVSFAALLGSFRELNDGFLAMTTSAKFASAFGSHIILGLQGCLCELVLCKLTCKFERREGISVVPRRALVNVVVQSDREICLTHRY